MTGDPILKRFAAPWHALAACNDPNLMYDPKRETEAKTICHHCPVRVDCLAAALRRGEPDGIWGGLNPNERTQLENTDPKQIPALMQQFAQRWRQAASRNRRAS